MDHFYIHARLTIYRCPSLKLTSEPDESGGEFRVRWTHALNERRQAALEELRERYRKRLEPLERRRIEAQRRAEREQSAAQQRTMGSLISAGSALVEALLGRKLASRTNVSRAGRSARDLQRAAGSRYEAATAQQRVDDLDRQYAEIEQAFEQEAAALAGGFDPQGISIETIDIPPTKKDIVVEPLRVVWLPVKDDLAE